MTFRLDPLARDEYLAAALYYLNESPRIAAAFVDQIEAGIAQIRKNPTTWRAVDGEVRRYLVRQFPFGIYYTIDGGEIVVWAILDLRRRPGYWRERRG
jgi:toxin ParE1/3/4